MNINPIKLYKYQKVYKTIKNSGLFDSKYYLFTYPDVRAQDIDPIKHYISYGAKEGRNPSSHFDTNYYLNTYKDIDANNINPLFHYIVYGQKEGRISISKKTIKKINHKSKACVLLHVFYFEDLKIVLDKLKYIEDFDLYITCRKEIETDVKKVLLNSIYMKAKVFVVENIGYDIFPFLYLVDNINIDKYNFFLKIHTKRGNANTGIKSNNIWFDMLTEPILNTKTIVQKVFEALNSGAGLVGTADMYRSNQTHMYGNQEYIDEIFKNYMNKNTVPTYNWGFIAGSIFWFSNNVAKTIRSYKISNKIIKNKLQNSNLKSGISNSIWHGFERVLSYFPIESKENIYLSYFNTQKKDSILIKSAAITNIPNGILINEKYSIVCNSKIMKDYEVVKKSKLFDESYYRKISSVSKDVDSVYHYLRYGFFESLDPSEFFSSEMYISMYEDVRKNFMNPFVHYILYGKKEGRKVIESTQNVKKISNKRIDVLASCWIGVEDPLLEIFFKLNNNFKKVSIKFEIISSNESIIKYLKNEGINCCKFSTAVISNNPNKLNNCLNSNLSKLLLADKIWIGEGADLQKISSVYTYWKEYLLNHQVKHMLIWGNTAPMSQLFIMLCQELEVEYTIIERGHFSGTLLADSLGQLGFGTKQKQFENNKVSLLSESYKKERMKEIISWIEKGTTSQYAEKNQKETDELKEILKKKKDKKILLFLGANDLGSGMKDLNTKPRANTWFRNSQDALNSLVEVLPNKFDDVLLVIKPHPSANLEVSDKLSNNNYIFANTTSINELIKNADVCVTTTSTVLGYCVAFGKPTLQFGITDSTNSNEIYDVWHPSVIASYLRDALNEQFFIDKKDGYSEYVLNLFDSHLIRVNEEVPTRLNVNDFASHLFNRVYKGVNSYEYDIIHNSPEVSKKLYDDIENRDRKYYDLNLMDSIDEKELPKLAIIIPVYDDLIGLRRNVERVVKYREDNNNYDIVLIWDCGPNIETLEYCREAQEKYGIDLIENKVNIGFSGTVNKGILKYKTHDVIVHNSDTIVHSDWAIRMQKSAYVDEEIGSVNPLSNNATLNNVPFPNGTPFPKEPIAFVEYIDSIAKKELKVAVEAPVSHGFCVFIKRSIIDIIGLFDEQKFGKGHSEDNEYSMRIRSKGFKCITTTNVFVGHDGSTSFKDEVMFWKLNGREVMNKEFPFYMNEIKKFFNNDPISKERKVLESHFKRFF